MGTVLRAEISKKNKYWISRHRYYELKYFCLQYPTWKKVYMCLYDESIHSFVFKEEHRIECNAIADSTEKSAMAKIYYSEKIDMIEKAAKEADPALSDYILKAVTEGLSYTHLNTKLNIPCSRDMYYDRYRRFFWLLHKAK